MPPKDAERMANSVDPDQTAPESSLFAQTYMSQYLNFLRYFTLYPRIIMNDVFKLIGQIRSVSLNL